MTRAARIIATGVSVPEGVATNVMLVAFGTGFSWGATLLRW